MRITLFGLALLCLQVFAPSGWSQSKADSKIYLIGNSLTADTLPSLLDGLVQWHIDCGKNLQFIHDHPEKPCVKNSTLWTDALRDSQFDILVVQPHMGTTLAQDVSVISEWMTMQPHARLILHTGWERHHQLETSFHTQLVTADDERVNMVHAPAYFQLLMSRLQSRFPDRKIATTRAVHLLAAIEQDIQTQRAPFVALKELYRDDIHMQLQSGRYLMHNAMRRALGQPLSEQGFQVEDEIRAYLDRKLAASTD